jgi:outer membrane murein-binding lipoprotein Lpp
MRFAVVLVALLLGGCVSTAPKLEATTAASSFPRCAHLDEMLRLLSQHAKFAYTADSIDVHARNHMLFVNPDTREWVQLGVKDNLEACIELEGVDWKWAVGR